MHADTFSVVGQRVPPIYGVGKATGSLKFPADIILPNMLWMKILRSPHAHARILEVDTSEALKIPGVVAVLTHKDVPQVLFGPYRNELYPLDEEVRFVGDAVAAVAAEDWNIAEEAVKAIRVKYEVLPAIFSPEEAAQPGATIAVLHLPETSTPWWDDAGDPTFLREASNVIGKAGQPTVVNKRGDVEKGFQESDYVIERVFHQPHVSGVAHEPRASVAYCENGGCTVWCSVQEPYNVQDAVARVLDLPHDAVRVISSTIGGGFGVKVGGRFAVLTALLARQTGRPVKIWFTREEETLDSHNRPALIQYVKAGAKKDGSIMAFRVRSYMDNGYWSAGIGANLAFAIVTRIMDLYHACPNVLWEIYVTRTNHPAAGPYRGRSDSESHFPIDTVVDELAHAAGMDPIEFRLKNRIHEGEDLCSAPGKVMSGVGVEEAVRKGAEVIGWERRQKTPGAAPGPKKRGIGMAMVIHSAGSTPLPSQAMTEIDQEGRVLLFSGQSDQGSEHQTTLRQMVAEVLGVSLSDVGGANADTSNCPHDSGPISSRTVYSTGIAATRSAEDCKKKLLEQASNLLEARPEDLELGGHRVRVRGNPGKEVTYGEIASGAGGSLKGWGYFNAQDEKLFTYGFAGTFAEVEVDVETGEVKVLRLVSSHDIGRAINPTIVEGQIQGGVAQGLGYAVSEGFYFDPETGTVLNQWFLDLKTPSILDTPDIEPVMVELGEPSHPFGAKGCSEIPYVGVAPAIANAIYNATGVRLRELPMTPERVLAALQEGAA
jgi:CO/xanthine dehydrogenase Mo-binding subunit